MLTDLVVFESLMQEVVRVLEHSLDGRLTQPGVRVQLRPPTEHKLLKRRRLALAVTESDCWPGRQHRYAVQHTCALAALNCLMFSTGKMEIASRQTTTRFELEVKDPQLTA